MFLVFHQQSDNSFISFGLNSIFCSTLCRTSFDLPWRRGVGSIVSLEVRLSAVAGGWSCRVALVPNNVTRGRVHPVSVLEVQVEFLLGFLHLISIGQSRGCRAVACGRSPDISVVLSVRGPASPPPPPGPRLRLRHEANIAIAVVGTNSSVASSCLRGGEGRLWASSTNWS